MKKYNNKFINILFFIMGIILSLYNFYSINIFINLFTGDIFTWNYSESYIIFTFYVPFLLWILILGIFTKNIISKNISLKYFYSFLIFLFLWFLYYIFIFNNADVEKITDENFKTIQSEKSFSDTQNAYTLIDNFNSQIPTDIQYFKLHCLNTNTTCDEEEINSTLLKSLEYLENNLEKYENHILFLTEISHKKFLKNTQEFWEFLSMTGFTTLIKFQKVVDQKLYNQNNFDEIISTYQKYFTLSKLLRESDTGLISLLVSKSLWEQIIENFEYLWKNNSLSISQKNKISQLISQNIVTNPDEIFQNVVISEYQSFIDNSAKINNSLIFDLEEFKNYSHYLLYKNYIELNSLPVSNNRNIFTQSWIYNFFIPKIDFQDYKSDIIQLKQKQEKFILEINK